LERGIPPGNVHHMHHLSIECDQLGVFDGDSTLFHLRGIVGLDLYIRGIALFSVSVSSR